jgi:hypothetical protein
MKKNTSLFLIISILIIIVNVPIHTAQAQFIVADPPTEVATFQSQVFDGKEWLETISGKILKRLANRVLQNMLKKTVNWAVTGFGSWDGDNAGGQPFYVQNQDSLIRNIEDQQLLSTIQELGEGCKNNDCPYAKDLARTLVLNTITNNKNKINEFTGNQYSDNWAGFIEGQFSEGGWAAWEGMYRNPQNSQFGAFLDTAFHVEDKKQLAVGQQLAKLSQNAGFLSVEKCVETKDGLPPTSDIDFTLFSKFNLDKKPDIDTNQLANNTWGVTNTIDQIGNGSTDPVFLTQGSDLVDPITNDIPPGQTDPVVLSKAKVDNCLRYETTTPGLLVKDLLSKTLISPIDKQVADSTTGNALLNSVIDMAAVFVEQGLDKLITKATTRTGDQKLYRGGFGDENTTYIGTGNGISTNSAWYSENGVNQIVIQDPTNPAKLHPDIIEEIEMTKKEIEEIEIILEMLRAQPDMYRQFDECLPGPDHGWEQRLKDEFNRSSKRLEKKSQKDNKKGDKAQEAIARLERYRDQEISKTKLAVLKVIPSAVPMLGKMSTMANLMSDLRQNEQKLTNKINALAILVNIQDSLASGTVNDSELIEIKKQYSAIKNIVTKQETLDDTLQDKQKISADIFTSFDQSNPKSLISKCINERKRLDDKQIGEDIGQTLFCPWQTHSGFNNASSPYDPGRSVQVWIGNKYTQDEAPFDSSGKDGEFQVDCNKYYRASMSVYEDNK